MSKWVCKTEKCKKPCYAEPPEHCYPTGCLLSRNNTPNWHKETESTTNGSQLPKLTAEVFDHPDCPRSALWATVDEDGTAYVHLFAPMLYADKWQHTNCCKKIPGKWDATNWTEIIQRPEEKTVPKLTAEVFDREDCPSWAQWAAVDENGKAYYFTNKPKYYSAGYFRDLGWGAGAFMLIGDFDASDWQNSLIERPEPEFPEWCQKGKWVCTYDRFKKGWEYFKVNETKRNCISSDNGLEYSFYDLKQARLRPYNAEEMQGLVGKVVGNKHGNMFLVTAFVADNGGEVCVDGVVYNADDLLECYTIDGKPCGVLEHLENREWVE